ncbi:GNAT family N-acetyltransferase [Lysobacter xanthus]
MIAIRAARIADAAEIARLSAQLADPVTPECMAVRLAAFVDDAPRAAFVADTGDALAGWIAVERRMTLETGEAFEITGLVVDAAQRRSGVGARLVAAADAWRAAQGGQGLLVRSNVVRAASHAFYASLGFQFAKTQHVYRRAPRG